MTWSSWLRSRDFIDPSYFGGAADGPDASAAIRLACQRACEPGQPRKVVLGPGTWRVCSDGSTDPLGVFSNVNGVELDMRGTLQVDREWINYDQQDLFIFDGCDGIGLPRVDIRCPQAQPDGQTTFRGARAFKFRAGCTGIRVGVARAKNLRQLWWFTRLQTEPTDFICRDIDLGLTLMDGVGYGVLSSLSGDGLRGKVVSRRCGRSVFLTGITGVDLDVDSTDHQASVNVLLATDYGFGVHNVNLRYRDVASVTADASINAVRLEIQDSDKYVSRHSRVNVDLDIAARPGCYQGFGFAIGKVKSDDKPDPLDRGQTIEDVIITGSISGTASQRSLDIGSVGTWGAGERLRNIKWGGLALRGCAPASIHGVIQP